MSNLLSALPSSALPSIAKFSKSHGIVPLKKFGQNFIFDESLCDKIVKASKLSDQEIALEIGPGPAGLTRSILKTNPQKLIAIETDQRCLPLLEEIQKIYPILEIRHADALKVKLKDLCELEQTDKLKIIANLPYNIGTALLISWLHQINYLESMTLMLQKEVVERIIAKPGTKFYGRLSVICQLLCNVEKCFDVSPKAFYPAPKVWSSIVHLKPLDRKIEASLISQVEVITNLAFSGRRKMIKSSLKTLSPDIIKIFKSLNIDDNLRAENLSPTHYLELARSL